MHRRVRCSPPVVMAVAIGTIAGLTALAPAATAASPYGPPRMSADRSVALPKTPAQPRHLATIGGPGGAPVSRADATAIAAAADKADDSGRPVTVGAMTTPTMTLTVHPDDELSVTEHIFPVRVRRPGGWVHWTGRAAYGSRR